MTRSGKQANVKSLSRRVKIQEIASLFFSMSREDKWGRLSQVEFMTYNFGNLSTSTMAIAITNIKQQPEMAKNRRFVVYSLDLLEK